MTSYQASSGSEAPRRPTLNLVSRPPEQQLGRVVGKVISQKSVKNNAVFSMLKAAWAGYATVRMTDLSEGVMAFDFANAGDHDRVLDMSPWAIHGHCLNLQVCEVNQHHSDVNFEELQVWVQIHGLSLDMLTKDNDVCVAGSLGK